MGAVRGVGVVGALRALRVVGAGGGWSCWAAIEHYFLFSSLLNGEYGSMWAVGGVGVLEERKACGQWQGRVRAVGAVEERKACGQWRGRVGAVRAVGVVGAVRAGDAGGCAGAAIEHYFGEYGIMWAVGVVGVLEERKACGQQ